MQIPHRFARARRYFNIVTGVGCWSLILYVVFNKVVTSWWGALVCGSFIVAFGVVIWREAKGVARARHFDRHLDAEQLSSIIKLREIVAAAEAHSDRSHTWKDYFSRQYRIPKKRPHKPSFAEIETTFKECEDAVGPFDVNMQQALSALHVASHAQQDMELERWATEKYVLFIEDKKGKNSEALILVLARLGSLHFTEKKYAECVEDLSRALGLHDVHSRENPKAKGLLTYRQFLYHRKLLAIAYTLAENIDAAEALLTEILPVLEEEEGVLSSEPFCTQSMRGTLIAVYVKQGWKALKNTEEDSTATTVSRYLRDALQLAAVHPSFYAHNLKHIGRLFIWAGKMEDGTTAFRLANKVFENGVSSGMPQRNCLCSTEEGDEAHGFRSCDACSKKIGLGDRWFFCRTCVDVDLCVECYAGSETEGGRGWENVQKFPRKCLGHEFFEVREDEKEERLLVHVWMADVSKELSLEAERRN